jgi:hypothetical protein
VTTLLVKAGALRREDWGLLGRAVFIVARVRIALWILPWRRLQPLQAGIPPAARIHP